jgi:hypothetical protein
MSMSIIIITNIELPPNIAGVPGLKIYFFNPWGFSKHGIEVQTRALTSAIDIAPNDKVYLCIKDLFFGNRSRITFTEAQKNFPNNTIVRIDSSVVHLLFNELPI